MYFHWWNFDYKFKCFLWSKKNVVKKKKKKLKENEYKLDKKKIRTRIVIKIES